MADNFQAEQKDKYLEKSRDLLSDLPIFCTDFINDKLAATKYRPLTCYAYANDLNMFFDFLACKNGLFPNICKKDISLADMEQISYRILPVIVIKTEIWSLTMLPEKPENFLLFVLYIITL